MGKIADERVKRVNNWIRTGSSDGLVRTTVAQQLADACVRVARANHYRVGLVGPDVSFDDMSDAQQRLIEMEASLNPKVAARAHAVLEAECRRQHGCAL